VQLTHRYMLLMADAVLPTAAPASSVPCALKN